VGSISGCDRYHHLTVMCYGFYTFSVFPSTGRWFMVMNYCVHSIMYSYYALRAMRIKVPTGFAMMITSLQLLQMVVGCAINLMALNYKSRGELLLYLTKMIILST